MSLQPYQRSYHYGKGLNLLQQGFRNAQHSRRMVVFKQSNRAIDEFLYHRLDLTPREKANPEQTFQDKGIFDTHGNQLKAGTINALTWDYRNMLQTTTQDHVDDTKTVEYNVYAIPGRRSKKVTETIDKNGKIVEIEEAVYLNNLEYRTMWKGNDLHYDGETVTVVDEGGKTDSVLPNNASRTLRVREGHKQVTQIKTDTTDQSTQTHFYLDNHINSCQMVMDTQGNLQSYLAFYAYGETAVSLGSAEDQHYKFSGQEQDKSGLYYYGFRSYLPENFRWISPDPIGFQGGQMNWYAMVRGNPVSFRDIYGLCTYKTHRLTINEAKRFHGISELKEKTLKQAIEAGHTLYGAIDETSGEVLALITKKKSVIVHLETNPFFLRQGIAKNLLHSSLYDDLVIHNTYEVSVTNGVTPAVVGQKLYRSPRSKGFSVNEDDATFTYSIYEYQENNADNDSSSDDWDNDEVYNNEAEEKYIERLNQKSSQKVEKKTKAIHFPEPSYPYYKPTLVERIDHVINFLNLE